MGEKLTVSIIIPTYGRPENLVRAINSVINQSYKQWEVIVVDDNNPNTTERYETEKVMQLFNADNRIKYVCHDKNMNGSTARNTGISIAKGEYISFLDDDDEYTYDRIEKCVRALSATDCNIAGVYTGCEFYKNSSVYRKKNNAKTGNYLVETLATTFESYSGSNLFLKKEVVIELQGFDTSFIRHQDYEFLVRVFEKYDLIGINEILLKKYETWSNQPNISRMENVKKQYLNKYRYIIDELTEKDRKYIMYSNMISLALMSLEVNDDRFAYFYKSATKYKFPSLKDLARIIMLRLERKK